VANKSFLILSDSIQTTAAMGTLGSYLCKLLLIIIMIDEDEDGDVNSNTFNDENNENNEYLLMKIKARHII